MILSDCVCNVRIAREVGEGFNPRHKLSCLASGVTRVVSLNRPLPQVINIVTYYYSSQWYKEATGMHVYSFCVYLGY
jgi:hypothetical protein